MSEKIPVMVERVARAQAGAGDPPGHRPSWKILGYASKEAFVEATWMNYVPKVIAGMQAMREATEAMQVVGFDRMPLAAEGCSGGFGDAADVWKVMLDAALGEKAVPR